MTILQAFELALQHHQTGRFVPAEAFCRQILAAQPNHAGAQHLLGVIACQIGQPDLAVEWIRQAIVIEPANPAAHCHLGEACRAAGRFEQAIAAYRCALELQPDYPEAYLNLGVTLAGQGQLEEAMAAYRQALHFKPGYPEAHNNLGHALRAQGRIEEAIVSYRRALDFKPDYLEAHNNLGNALAEQGQLDEAIAVYLRAAQLQPDFPETHFNLGIALREQGQLDEAIGAYRRALQFRPDFPEAHNNLGVALRDHGCFEEAMAACRHALQLQPNFPEAHNNLGLALAGRGRLHEAMAAYRRALELWPDFPEAHNNLGNAFKDLGQLDEAIESYRRALQTPRVAPGFHSNLIYALHFHPGYSAAMISEERQRWNQYFGQPRQRSVSSHSNDPAIARPLRIGYVSPDFRNHVVGRNLIPLFRRHDPQAFEIFCYSGVIVPDELTIVFQQHAKQWRSTVGVRDDALAETIRRDGVDILVDLTQHMAGNRLPMFARQPAPVQVSFAGYPETTGLAAIEYRISDRYLEQASAQEAAGAGREESKEQLFLIDSFWCYDPCGLEVEVNRLPALDSNAVTFGCLGNFCKVSERSLTLWARVLAKVKESRLLISSPTESRPGTLAILEKEGIDARRVEFVEYRPRREYLELYHRVDIVLDTFPYNGHTTSLDALWMGAPVVTLAGPAPVSRAGLSQLTNLGLPELIAHSETEYINIAERLAVDLSRLAELRSTLRARMQSSPLMDAPQFARNIEAVYRSMWTSHASRR